MRNLIIAVLALLFITLPCIAFPQTTYTLTGNMCGTGLTAETAACKGGLISETYLAGTSVTLTPSVKPGYVFVGWLGEGLWGNKVVSIVMNSDKFVAAIFEPIIKRKLYTTVWGTGNGKITSTPAGINCGAACVFEFNENTKVVLKATPDAGSVFKGWRPSTLACYGTVATCSVSMTKAKIVTALFSKQ